MRDAGGRGEPTGAELDFRSARREERKDTNWIAKIRLFDGQEIATTVKNVSPSGALLTVPESMDLPERFMFRVIGRDFVCAVKLAWRRGSHVGVQIERVGKLDPKAVKPLEAPAPEPAASEPGGAATMIGRRGMRMSEV